MLKLQRLLRRETMAGIDRDGFRRELAERVFEDWRDRYIAALAASIRVQWEAKRAGIKTPVLEQSREWCNAAIQLLTIPGIEIQDYFLRADPDLKNTLVRAVLADGGILNIEGFFVGLPPLT